MSVSGVSPVPSWLASFDPIRPATLTALLAAGPTGAGKADSPVASAAPSPYQQALNAFTVSADTFLIQSVTSGGGGSDTPAAPAGSTQALFASLQSTLSVLKNAGLSGNYGSLSSLA